MSIQCHFLSAGLFAIFQVLNFWSGLDLCFVFVFLLNKKTSLIDNSLALLKIAVVDGKMTLIKFLNSYHKIGFKNKYILSALIWKWVFLCSLQLITPPPVKPSIRNRKVVCISPTAKGTFVPQLYGTMSSFDTLHLWLRGGEAEDCGCYDWAEGKASGRPLWHAPQDHQGDDIWTSDQAADC